MHFLSIRNFLLLSIFGLFIAACSVPQPQAVTKDDYQRAEQFLGQNTHDLVLGDVSGQAWTSGNKLMYNTQTSGGIKYILANPSTGEKKQGFNQQKLAEKLSELTGKNIDADSLSLYAVNLSNDGKVLRYSIRGGRYETHLTTYKTSKSPSGENRNEIVSPDGKKAAYIKDYNLWIRNTETGKRTQLTTDGKKDYGYATNNAGWTKSDQPILLWGPHSEQIATFQQDARGVGEMYLYNSQVGHSKLVSWKGSMPGDSVIFKIERVVIHLRKSGSSPKVVRLKMDADPQRSTISDEIAGRGGKLLDTQWSKDGSQLAFVSVSRNHKVNKLRVANPNTGRVRNVLQEKADTYYESGFSKVSWHVMKNSNEVIWFSERDNWAHLYLYDLTTGKLKHQITKGNWRVLDLEYADEKNRTIYFTGSNREKGNPYYQYLYKINFDGSGLTNLTPEQGNHQVTWSPSKQYFTDTYSTPVILPVSVIRNTDGKAVMKLEQADISKLKAKGWVPPVQFKVKARDGKTDLYGLMFKPSNFDSSKSYPIINYVYPGPQTGSVGSRSFRASRGDNQALAELGFIVVEVDAMGTPGRTKAFHDAWYGHMADMGIPDQVTMMKQLARRHSWIDIDRAGIWGHSGGGNASTRAILAWPDFFKVAVSESGNHDTRNYESDWGDKWQGLLKKKENVDPDTLKRFEKGDNFDSQANELLADNLKGHLLLAHGLMDTNVPPTITMMVAEALIRASKDFDEFFIPNVGHGYGYASTYFRKRRWNYFVRYLKGVKPASDFQFTK